MCSWRRVAVARVFAIEIEGRKYPFKLRPPAAKKVLNHQPVFVRLAFTSPCKNRDTRRGSPAAAGAGRTADHLAVLFSQKVLAVRKSQ